MLDPIFGRSLDFYLFTLPAWQLISGWLLTLSVIACADRRRVRRRHRRRAYLDGAALLPRRRRDCGAACRSASPRCF